MPTTNRRSRRVTVLRDHQFHDVISPKDHDRLSQAVSVNGSMWPGNTAPISCSSRFIFQQADRACARAAVIRDATGQRTRILRATIRTESFNMAASRLRLCPRTGDRRLEHHRRRSMRPTIGITASMAVAGSGITASRKRIVTSVPAPVNALLVLIRVI